MTKENYFLQTNLQLWDYLLWEYLLYKILLYKKNKEKKQELFHIIENFSQHLPPPKYKQYRKSFQDFWKINDFRYMVETKNDLLSYMTKFRSFLVSKNKNLMYDFEKQMNDIKKIALKRKITLKNPTLWGNTTWLLLHLICLDVSNVSSKELLIETILHSLPCRICKNHAIQYITNYPLQTNQDMMDFHNDVNVRLNKRKSYCPKRLFLRFQKVQNHISHQKVRR